MVTLQQSRLAWEATLKKVRADKAKLTKEIVDRFQGDPGLEQAQRAAARVTQALESFDEELTDILDRALNAENPEARSKFHGEAAAIIEAYLANLDADPVIAMLDTNPYMPVAIHKTLATTLNMLASKLS
jgi:hypothetical protein